VRGLAGTEARARGRISKAAQKDGVRKDDVWPVGVCAAAIAAVVAVLVVKYGGALSAAAIPDLTQTGAVTLECLAVSKLAMNTSAALTVGWLLMAAVFVPSDGPASSSLDSLGRRCLRAASLSAVAWAASTAALVVFSVSDIFGIALGPSISGDMLRTFLLELPQGRALLLVVLVATALSVAAHLPKTPGGAGYLLLVALCGLMPPLFTGHAASAGNHALAVYSLAVHIVAAAAWVGGLIVLLVIARHAGDRLPAIVTRYSGLALVCFLAVGASGLANAWVRLGGLELGSNYGLLVVGKAAVLAVLGTIGLWHRRAGIPALTSHRRTGVFVRIATVEVLVMAVAMGLATGLSRTPPPEVDPGTLDPVALRLGFKLPGPANVRGFALDWWPDPLFAVLITAAAVLYAVAVVRLRRNGGSWPLSRIVAWHAGLLVVLAATCSGLARYSMVLFSAHVAQHLALSMLAPPLLVAGAPLTLALRTLPAGPASSGRSPRELLLAATQSRLARALTRPLVALALLLAGLYGFYFTFLFETTLRNHAWHSLTMLCFTLTGLLYFWSIVGVDSAPGHRDLLRRLVLLLAAMPLHALFGIALMLHEKAFAADWYKGLGRTWGASPLDDQRLGAVLALGVAEIVTLLVMLSLARTYARESERSMPVVAAR
jgi:cytochrome c oxidase assembly factor CtaG/putative copper export protein